MSDLPSAPFPILTTVAAVRAWTASLNGASVGFVPTMGALHAGHLSLGPSVRPIPPSLTNTLTPCSVEASLRENDHTIVSIFVNPAQFAPHEDLSTYPRTLTSDLKILSSLSLPSPTPSFASPTRRVSALFLPPVEALYPSGITTDVSQQVGAFVEVKGLQDYMEGGSRPGFFRGVATVVLKLFNIVMVCPVPFFFERGGGTDVWFDYAIHSLLTRRLLYDSYDTHRLSSDDAYILSPRSQFLSSLSLPASPPPLRPLTLLAPAHPSLLWPKRHPTIPPPPPPPHRPTPHPPPPSKPNHHPHLPQPYILPRSLI